MSTTEKLPIIVPRGNQILIRPDSTESKESKHGIIMPDNVQEETKAFGTVEAVGPEITDVKKGDRVIYGLFAGERISQKKGFGTLEWALIPNEDVLAFLRD